VALRRRRSTYTTTITAVSGMSASKAHVT
jgi:hypothetical protein